MADRSLRIKLLADTSSYRSEMERASRLGNNYYKSAQSGSQRLTAYLNQNTTSFAGLNKNIQVATNTLKTFAGAFLGGFAVSGIVNTADSYGQMAQRIKNSLQSVEGDFSNYDTVQKRLLETSIRNAKELADSQELYIRSAESMKSLGYSTEQTLDFVESLSSAFTSNATSSEKVQSSINALNKSLVSGKVGIDQWRTLVEAMPNLTGELAKSMGKTREEVVKLGNGGKLSTAQLASGLIKAKDSFNELADSMDNTVKDGFVQLSSAFQAWIGEANQTHKVTATLVQGMTYLAKNFDIVVNSGTAIIALSLARYFGNLSTSMLTSAAASVKNAAEIRGNALAQKELALAELQQIAIEKQSIATTQQALQARAANSSSIRANMYIRKTSQALQLQEMALNEKEIDANNRLAAAKSKLSVSTTVLNKAQGVLKNGLALVGGPVGAAMLAGTALLYYSHQAEEAKRRSLELSVNIDVLTESFKKMNQEQKDAAREKLSREMEEQLSQIKKQKNAIEDLTKSTQRQNVKYGFSLNGNPKEVAGDLKILKGELADMEKKYAQQKDLMATYSNAEEKVSESTNELLSSTKNLNSAFSDTAKTGIDGKLKSVSEQLEIAELNQKGLSREAYIYQNALSALGKEASTYKTALKGLITGSAEMADLSEKEAAALQPLIDKLGELYDTGKSYKSEVINLNKDLALLRASYEGNSAEAKILSLEQETGTKIIGKQREKLLDLYNLTVGYNSLSKLANPIDIELESYDKAKAALEDWFSHNKNKSSEYYSQLEKLKADHQIKMAQIRSEQTVSEQNKAVAVIDPVQALANEQAKKLALIQEFENQKLITEQNALALREAASYKYEQNRIAAQWEIWRNQSLMNDFLASSLDGLASSATSTIAGLMSGTMDATEAMRNFSSVILNQAVGSLVQVGVQTLQNAILSKTASETTTAAQIAGITTVATASETAAATATAAQVAGITALATASLTASATTTAAQIAEAAALAAAYTPAAIQASIASYGAAATTGAAAYSAAMGTMTAASIPYGGGREHGGGVFADTLYRVGENNKPEIFQSGNKQYMIPGDNGKVISNNDLTTSPSTSDGGNGWTFIVENNASGAEVQQPDIDREKRIVKWAVTEVANSVRNKQGDVWNAFKTTTNVKSRL